MNFKNLTPDNWRDPDPISTQFWRESRVLNAPVAMDDQGWARTFLGEELKEHVPEEIRDLFAAARGALLYGWYFYPLFRLGEEQLYRVVEAAAAARYHQLGGMKQEPSFAETIKWLMKAGIIPEEDEPRWAAARGLRNRASHPRHQVVMPPGAVLEMLKATSHDINRLFARQSRANS